MNSPCRSSRWFCATDLTARPCIDGVRGGELYWCFPLVTALKEVLYQVIHIIKGGAVAIDGMLFHKSFSSHVLELLYILGNILPLLCC